MTLCPETITYTPTNGETGLPFPQQHIHCTLPDDDDHGRTHRGTDGAIFGRLGDGQPDSEVRTSYCSRCDSHPAPTSPTAPTEGDN